MNRPASMLMTFATALALTACGGSGSTDPGGNGGGGGGGDGGDGGGDDGGAEPAAIAVVSGDGQSAKTQKPLGAPFVVEVTDADGAPVSDVTVSWTVVSGPGSVSPTSSNTDAQGEASATFSGGTTLGSSTIEAAVSGVSGTAEFAVETSTLVIRMQNIAFIAPGGSDAVTVPLGTTIEWENFDDVQHTATSTDTPSDGSSFDSNLIGSGGTFSFTPDATGTWTYFCEVHPTQMVDATITVTS
ncbi:MAG: Ig-like domain-containing protein [Gemmatimonadota bacterium]